MRGGAVCARLRAQGFLVRMLRVARTHAEAGPQAQKCVLHAALFAHLVHQAGRNAHVAAAKRVRHQVGQCLEFRAEATSPPHVGQAGNEQGVAAPDQVVHVAQVCLRSQAAFVDGQGVAARQDVPVRGTADHRRAADLCEKGLPQRRIAIVQERARQSHRSDIGVFRLGKQPQGVHARPLSCVLCRPGRACKEESYHERRRRARQSTATSFTQYSMSLPARGWLKSSVTTWFSMLTTFAGMGCAFLGEVHPIVSPTGRSSPWGTL